jgi:hypothetical protein
MADLGQDTAKVDKAMAAFCRADASAIVAYLKANARAVVSMGGLQRSPSEALADGELHPDQGTGASWPARAPASRTRPAG